MSTYTIRPATPDDAAALAAIYAPYVRETTITFEYDPPSTEEFAHRIKVTREKYPYFVCCDGDTPVGYAYAHAFRERAAYDWDVEMSIYVDRTRRHNGIGRLLYAALEEALAEMGIVNCYACITSPNPDSVAFHNAVGYETLAVFPRSGFKFGRWLDVIWMVKQVNPCENPPIPVTPWQEGEA